MGAPVLWMLLVIQVGPTFIAAASRETCGPAPQVFVFSASLQFTLAWRVLSSLQEEAEGPGTTRGLAAPASRCVPLQSKEPKHPCSCPPSSACPGLPRSQALQWSPCCSGAPSVSHQMSESTHRFQIPLDPRALVSCCALVRCIPEDPPTSPK